MRPCVRRFPFDRSLSFRLHGRTFSAACPSPPHERSSQFPHTVPGSSYTEMLFLERPLAVLPWVFTEDLLFSKHFGGSWVFIFVCGDPLRYSSLFSFVLFVLWQQNTHTGPRVPSRKGCCGTMHRGRRSSSRGNIDSARSATRPTVDLTCSTAAPPRPPSRRSRLGEWFASFMARKSLANINLKTITAPPPPRSRDSPAPLAGRTRKPRNPRA